LAFLTSFAMFLNVFAMSLNICKYIQEDAIVTFTPIKFIRYYAISLLCELMVVYSPSVREFDVVIKFDGIVYD